jgi:hypothetical protein
MQSRSGFFRLLTSAALATVASVAWLALFPDDALAGNVHCGDTITSDTTLRADLIGCPNNGIVIGANGVTLNLNGHVITGDATRVDPCPDGEFCDVGVVIDGHRGVRIKNGSLRDFSLGVFVLNARGSTLRHLHVVENMFLGVAVVDSARVRIAGNVIKRNGVDTDESGLGIFSSQHNWIKRNLIARNGDIGLYAESIDGNVIARNAFIRNPEAGILMSGDSNLLARNAVRQNGDGIVISGDDNTIRRNLIHRADGCGEGCGFGISFEGGRNPIIARNEIALTRETGIRYGAEGGLVRLNRIKHAGLDGIEIDPNSKQTRVVRNQAIASGDDGIDVKSSSTTITRSRAFRNGDLGIQAVAGVADGGGNRARNNGDPAQCTHVVCS